MRKLPNKLPVVFRERAALAEYDYDAGESQWFDAKDGVGSPGYPPSVELVDLWDCGTRIPVEELTDAELESLEQQLMDQIDVYTQGDWE